MALSTTAVAATMSTSGTASGDRAGSHHASSAQSTPADEEYDEDEEEEGTDDEEDSDDEEDDSDEEGTSSSVDEVVEEEPPIDWNNFDADAFVQSWLNAGASGSGTQQTVAPQQSHRQARHQVSQAQTQSHQPWNLAQQQRQPSLAPPTALPANTYHSPQASFPPHMHTPTYHMPAPTTPAPNYDSAIEILTKVLGEGQEVPTEILAMILQSIAPSLGYQPPTPSQQPGIDALVPILRGLIERQGGATQPYQQTSITANQFGSSDTPATVGHHTNDEEEDDEDNDPSYDPASADLDINGALEEQMNRYLSGATEVEQQQQQSVQHTSITPPQDAATSPRKRTRRTTREEQLETTEPSQTRKSNAGRHKVYETEAERKQARLESNRKAQREFRARRKAQQEEQDQSASNYAAASTSAVRNTPPTSLAALQEENRELRAADRVLRQELARLQRENVELRVEAGIVKRMRGGGGGRKRRRAPPRDEYEYRYDDEEDEGSDRDHYEDDDGYDYSSDDRRGYRSRPRPSRPARPPRSHTPSMRHLEPSTRDAIEGLLGAQRGR